MSRVVYVQPYRNNDVSPFSLICSATQWNVNDGARRRPRGHQTYCYIDKSLEYVKNFSTNA